jgi:hypothetical protein
MGGVLTTQAQTDVTSTYLTNADFSQTTALTGTYLYGYGKDGSPYGMQAIDGWTSVVTAGDNSTANSPNSGVAGGVFSYGSSTQLKGNSKAAPATNPDGEATGNCFGFFGVWGCGGYYYQNVTLAAGKYTITVPMYNQSGTQANTTYTGFFPTSGTNRTVAVNPTVGQWVNQTVTFTLADATEGQIRIGYQSTGSGSSANPMLFIDCVKITWTDPAAAEKAAALEAAKYTLNGYIKKAIALNAVLSNATLASAIITAQGVYDDADDYAEDFETVGNASTTLSSAISTALSDLTPVALTNGNFDTTPNNTLNGDKSTTFGGTLSTATSNPDNTKDMTANTGDHAYLYEVTGWTQYSKFNSTASQGTTSEYGTAMPANGWSTNSTTPPATDMLGGSTGAALHLSAGWNDQARYQQMINDLPSGRYVFYYEVINQYTNTSIASNYTGVNGAAGDFYGTTNSFVYSNLKSAAAGEWIAQAFEFDVAKTANLNFSVGVTTSTGGSANGAKLWIDNVLVYRIADLIVTDDDATAIIESAEALDEVVFNATDKSDLATKLEAFKAAKSIDNYNALNAAIIQANASKDVYTTLNTAITKVESWTATTAAAGLRTKYNNGEYANDVTAADIYAEYQVAEIEALNADVSAVDWTSIILNASFETGDMTGWSAESRDDTGVKDQSNGTYSITSGIPVDGSKLFNSWGGTAENNVYQTIKNLPTGTYTLSAVLAGHKDESLVLAANETTNNVVVAGDKTVGYSVFVTFTLDDAGDVVIKASNTKGAESSDASFIKADKFRLFKGNVMTNDYTALNAAIEAAEAKTLGFDKGEYAPYNNVDALTKLATAKSVDQGKTIAQPILNSIVSDLTSASWTANEAEVNAVHNGNFATGQDLGWTFSKWGEFISGLNENTNASNGTARSSNEGNLTYGNKTGYTMPLDGNTVYRLTFKVSSWDDNNKNTGTGVSVLNSSNEGLATKDFAGSNINRNNAGAFKTYTTVFETGEAGDYTLVINARGGRSVYTDIVLVKAVADVVTISEEDTAIPTASDYANVTLTRTLSADYWNSFSVPFDAAIPSGWDVKEFDSATDNVINFKNAESIVAGKPYLVKPSVEAVNPTFNGVEVKSMEGLTDGEGDYKFAAQIYNKSLATDGTIAYLATDGAVKKFTSGSIKGLRAYFIIPVGGESARINFIDEETTGIQSMTNGALTNGNAIYDMQGRRVESVKKGLYIMNGKKVVVK